ncbi:MAG: hypothetical protein GY749_39740 [Desulfobacteraceae bacterium]|nr:hypothetical protein [Desulfobacteraceae bacterium]
MDQNQKNETGAEALFAYWIKSATDFWGEMAKMQPGASDQTGKSEKNRQGAAMKAQKSWESGAKIMQAMISTLSEPENLNALLKGTETVPEFTMEIAHQMWDGYFELQKKVMDRAVRLGQQTKAYDYTDIDQDLFKTLREMYEKEFQKYLNVPQIGLTRFYQERMTKVVDKYSIFQTALSEFLYMFYVPIEKSLMIMQEKVEQMAEEGDIHDNYKDYYNMWVKVLEGHYMTLLQSQEYTDVMKSTIDSLVQYREAKDEFMYDILQKFPIPTNKDMDELYKDLYLLKKQVKELTKQVKEMRSEK